MRLLFFLLLTPGTALADTWEIDKSHSEVSFSVTHMMVSTVTGSFGTFTGSLETSADGKPTAITGEVAIVSIDTRNEKRDGHLQKDDFFSAEKFPKATFASTAIVADGEGYSVTGNLTIRDITKEVVLKLDAIRGPVNDPWGNTRIGTVGTTTINRQDFGVSWSKLMDNGGVVVSDEVELALRIELKKAK